MVNIGKNKQSSISLEEPKVNRRETREKRTRSRALRNFLQSGIEGVPHSGNNHHPLICKNNEDSPAK